jgi:hypothetical protein
MDNITLTKLALISERARKEPKFQFTSLAHLLNEGFLKECYYCFVNPQVMGKAFLVGGYPLKASGLAETPICCAFSQQSVCMAMAVS